MASQSAGRPNALRPSPAKRFAAFWLHTVVLGKSADEEAVWPRRSNRPFADSFQAVVLTDTSRVARHSNNWLPSSTSNECAADERLRPDASWPPGLGTPVVGIFTCTSPTISGPPGDRHELVATGVTARPAIANGARTAEQKPWPHGRTRRRTRLERLLPLDEEELSGRRR